LTPNAVQAIQDFDRQALHAAVLGFEHPVSGEMMRFEADLPTDMITLLSNL
jgi:23S rRNA pseudouridine1911/1915/1917 synthase